MSKAKEKPVIDNTYKLEKFPGKGGWTFALIKDVKKVNGKFPKLKVKGTIDGFKIEDYVLMPYKRDGLFLPVRAEIRKRIGKEAGNRVKVVLYHDDRKFVIPDEFLMCLGAEPEAYVNYKKLSESEQRLYVLWIFSGKKMETRAERIGKTIERLLLGKKLYKD
jgi:hypothetical protein